MILDEPTAVLTPDEAQALFKVLAQMVAQGLSIIFISHKLGEVLRVSHRIAVLRDGKLVAQTDASKTTQAQLAQWIGGALDARRRLTGLSCAAAALNVNQMAQASAVRRTVDCMVGLLLVDGRYRNDPGVRCQAEI